MLQVAGASTSASSSSVPYRCTEFPPAAGDASGEMAEELRLRLWCDALLGLLEEVQKGSTSEAPLEEVWHWLSANERLTRSLAFVESAKVQDLVTSVAEVGSHEGEETVRRWQAAARQLSRAQKESRWNAEYLRVVEEPLKQLGSEEVIGYRNLPGLVQRLLRSLHRIFCTCSYFKEHRMALFLHKVLKQLIHQANVNLTPLNSIAQPLLGFETAMTAASQFRDSFKSFVDHYFISDVSSADRGDGRPATALGSKGDQNIFAGARSKRRDVADLGWWKATMRTSLEQAEHCQLFCDGIAGLLAGCRTLTSVLAGVDALDPELRLRIASFLELHSGIKGSEAVSELLDIKLRAEARIKMQEAEERLATLFKELRATGVSVDGDICAAADSAGVQRYPGTGGLAEVLTLPGGSPEPRPATTGELQADIDSIQEELHRFGEQLDDISKTIAERGERGRLCFAPPARSIAGAMAMSTPESHEMRDSSAAMEVARRSAWYVEPPRLIPEDVPLISVSSGITVTRLHRCPSRPRTAQPRLLATRAGPADVACASAGSHESGEPGRTEAALESQVQVQAEMGSAADVEAEPEPVETKTKDEIADGEEHESGEEGRELDPLGATLSWRVT